MKWRCEWCEKPHAENDPPCDNCGHGSFERAVVPMGPESTDGQRTPEWVCTECGRRHQKHSPPCSRCGNATLRKNTQHPDEFEDVGSTGWLDVLEVKYVVGYVVAGLFLVTVLLATAGVINLPGTADGNPRVENVPGNDTTVNGLDIDAVEQLYLDQLNDRRAASGYDRLDRSHQLTELATFYNKHEVKQDYGDGSGTTERQREEIVGDACTGTYYRADFAFTSDELAAEHPEPYRNKSVLAAALVTAFVENTGEFSNYSRGATGVDIHMVNGELYLAQFAC